MFVFQCVNLPHILMPGHIWESRLVHCIFILLDVRFECWVFTDEAGVQQDDIRAQDGFDHLYDLRVLGQAPHPWILKVNIVEAVLGVFFTWKHTEYTHSLTPYSATPYINLLYLVMCGTKNKIHIEIEMASMSILRITKICRQIRLTVFAQNHLPDI